MQTRLLKYLVVIGCVISIVGISYAVTQVAFQNTSTILAGQNIFITQPVSITPASCPADGNVAYTNSPASVAWTLTAGSSAQSYFFCIDNQGSAPDAVSITSSLTNGACPATGNTLVYGGATNAPTSLPGHSVTSTPVNVSVCAGGAMSPTATGPTFTITVT
jgi:hypothetical protein